MVNLSDGPVRIVIADDHPIFRDGFKILLKKLKPNSVELVGEAGDGNELVELALKVRPHVIITDIQMPGIDGIEATKRIKKSNPNIQIIALSMFNEDHLVVDMLEAGASGYLLKNTSKTEFEQALRIVHEGGVYFTPEASVHLTKSIKQSAKPDRLAKLPKLTDREIEIIHLICKGKTNKEIASELYLSPRTIESHRENIYEKTETHSSAEVAIYAIRYNIIDIHNI
jgi:DNA-binding NarL/FixJ family response regulator